MSLLRLFWGWSGRLNRLDFLGGSLALSLASTTLMMILFSAFGEPASDDGSLAAREMTLILFCQVVAMPFQASMAVRRAHDFGVPGYALIGVVGFFAVAFSVEAFWPTLRNSWVGFVLVAPIGLAFILLILAPGSAGDNRFGPPR